MKGLSARRIVLASRVSTRTTTVRFRWTGIALATMIMAVDAPAIADPKAPARPSEAISYTPSSDRDVRVSVTSVVMPGKKGYLPKDRNWLQLHVSVSNIGKRPIEFINIRERLSSGTVVASATSSFELAKPPSTGATVGKTLGIGVAAQAAGMFIFPPAAILVNAIGLTGLGHESWQKRMKRIDAGILNTQTIAPNTGAEGDVYVPALHDHTGLIVFYTRDGRSETLTLSRQANPPAAE